MSDQLDRLLRLVGTDPAPKGDAYGVTILRSPQGTWRVETTQMETADDEYWPTFELALAASEARNQKDDDKASPLIAAVRPIRQFAAMVRAEGDPDRADRIEGTCDELEALDAR